MMRSHSPDSVVSVLFSEPKIPQKPNELTKRELVKSFSALQRAENSSKWTTSVGSGKPLCFSALQRAENSSKEKKGEKRTQGVAFQCSSASRKFLKYRTSRRLSSPNFGFSALQRAENSSNKRMLAKLDDAGLFQCSSASRKFLKLRTHFETRSGSSKCFSALQRAENSSNLCARLTLGSSDPFQCSSASRKFLKCDAPHQRRSRRAVSVLFSEPKIPQIAITLVVYRASAVSVLFSEPKIPQNRPAVVFPRVFTRFSALQRAENSSKV